MTTQASLTARFEAARPRLAASAYCVLGSVDDAQDVVQGTWLRLVRRPDGAHDLQARLTTSERHWG